MGRFVIYDKMKTDSWGDVKVFFTGRMDALSLNKRGLC